MSKLRAEDAELRLQRETGRDFLEVLARSIKVIEALGQPPGSGTLSDLARETNISKPSVRRILHTLCELGYAEHSGRAFSLTPKVMRLATSYLGRNGNSRTLQAACDSVASKTGHSCLVGVLDGQDVLVVAYTIPRQLMAPSLGVGAKMPAFCTAAGRILLGQLSDPELERFLADLIPVPQTEFTITDKARIRQEVQNARVAGFSVMENEFALGWKTVAYPVYKHDGSIFGTISLNCKNTPALSEQDFDFLASICRDEAIQLRSTLA